jgi:hypothetical protein
MRFVGLTEESVVESAIVSHERKGTQEGGYELNLLFYGPGIFNGF